MIRMHQFAAVRARPGGGPFCLGPRACFRTAEIGYETVNAGGPRKAPMGKLPHIDGDGPRMRDRGIRVGVAADAVQATAWAPRPAAPFGYASGSARCSLISEPNPSTTSS